MFITRFTTVAKEIQDYYYHHAKDALTHLSLFQDDDSGLYRNICIIDDTTNTVLGILPFVDGKPQKLIVEGGLVRIKPEWCSPGDEKHLFRVSNIHEQLENASIICSNSTMMIKSLEIVSVDMIIPESKED